MRTLASAALSGTLARSVWHKVSMLACKFSSATLARQFHTSEHNKPAIEVMNLPPAVAMSDCNAWSCWRADTSSALSAKPACCKATAKKMKVHIKPKPISKLGMVSNKAKFMRPPNTLRTVHVSAWLLKL